MKKIRCFVAMAFNRQDTDAIYDKAIRPAIESLDMIPIRVDRITHNDRIDAKIREEIRNAEITIADLSYSRPSVYWEAGFAERQTPVVYTCRTDHLSSKRDPDDEWGINQVHFDLRNANIIPWEIGNISKFKNALLEILKYVSSPIKKEIKSEQKIKHEREFFKSFSPIEQRGKINKKLAYLLGRFGYKLAPSKQKNIRETYPLNHTGRGRKLGIRRRKKLGTSFVFMDVIFCRNKFLEKGLKDLLVGDPYRDTGLLSYSYSIWELLPDEVTSFTRRKIKSIRKILLLPSIDSVPISRINKVLPTYRKLGGSKHFYRPSITLYRHIRRAPKQHVMPTSSEVIFIDDIQSLVELQAQLNIALSSFQNNREPIIIPQEDEKIF